MQLCKYQHLQQYWGFISLVTISLPFHWKRQHPTSPLPPFISSSPLLLWFNPSFSHDSFSFLIYHIYLYLSHLSYFIFPIQSTKLICIKFRADQGWLDGSSSSDRMEYYITLSVLKNKLVLLFRLFPSIRPSQNIIL